MNSLGLLGLALLLLGGGGASSGPTPAPKLPAGTGTPPWPQVVPQGLPPFPGAGWQYDEPPPLAVQQRAGALLQQLWKGGAGTFKTEQTAGRWITYRAEKVRSGKQGVVAYRLTPAAAKPKPTPKAVPRVTAPTETQSRLPPAPAPAPRVVTSPGVPQATAQPATWNVDVGPAVKSPIQLPDLKRGDGIKPKPPDPNVALVQQKLGIKADGQFGKDTQTAVIVFQQRTGLAPADQTVEQLRARGFGAVKQATWTKLFDVRA